MRYLMLMILATVLVWGGCSHVSSTGDAGPVECNLGEYSGDFTIGTQSEVATLAGYTSISGGLEINCPSCTDLSELVCLTSVGGLLYMEWNTALPNLDGLSGLTSVGGVLYISWNAVLTNLDGLSALTSVGGYLYIKYNAALTNLDGLNALTSMGEGLYINDNDALTNLIGLSALTSVGEHLYIQGNDALPNLDGLSALTLVDGKLVISDNDILTNLDGLSGITSVGTLGIGFNVSLHDCKACELLDQFTSVPTSINVYDNLDDTCTPVPENCP